MRGISTGFDEFGNPVGRAFDLGGGDEDRVRGERILIYFCPKQYGVLAESEMRTLIAERGLQIDVRYPPKRRKCDLTEAMLSGYSQLWYVSDDQTRLTPQQVTMIGDYVRNGNGLAIWADNEPFYADANLLANALIGSGFSGNLPGDQVLVPGPALSPGRFIEHPLTQGVNNLYEGVTICTIHHAPGVTILGQSHDGQLCLGCFERDNQRIVLDTGFTKLYREGYGRSAGLGRYLSNIAFWLARGGRGVDYQLLTPGREEITTIANGEASKGYQIAITNPSAVSCILQWEGSAELALSVRAPDGTVVERTASPRSPVRISWRAEKTGTYVALVEDVKVPAARMPYVLTLSQEPIGRAGAQPIGRAGTQRSAAAAEQRTIMPFYIICDASAGAAETIRELNAMLRQIQQDLARRRVDANVMLSVIAFDDRARVVVPLTAPSKITLPTLQARGGTSYGAALREYHRTFEQDRARLKGTGARVFRPCVFFLTQRAPADADYAQTFRSLLGFDPATQQGNRAYPVVIPVGLTGASRSALATLAYPDFGDPAKRGRWFVTQRGAPAAEALQSLGTAISSAVTTANATVERGTPAFVPPASIPGMDSGIAERR